jgi:hypothetical protein
MFAVFGAFSAIDLQVGWQKTSVLGQARQHFGADFFTLMKGKHHITPTNLC